MNTSQRIALALVLLLNVQGAIAKDSFISDFARAAKQVVTCDTVSIPPAGTIEVGFSPDKDAEALVLKVVDASKRSVRVMAYSFTSAPIVRALLNAKHRGVDVQVIADQKSNTGEDRSGKSRSALSALVNAGIPVRLISKYAIHHDKVMIVDEETVETGSFNYSDAAARRNSENVIVIWRNPRTASEYLKHWESRYDQGQDFRPY